MRVKKDYSGRMADIIWLPMAVVGFSMAMTRAGIAKYKTWKSARTEINSYPNWRGVYVEDLKVKRFERVWAWGWTIFMIGSFVLYLLL